MAVRRAVAFEQRRGKRVVASGSAPRYRGIKGHTAKRCVQFGWYRGYIQPSHGTLRGAAFFVPPINHPGGFSMKELAKQYDPSQVEDRIYQFWLCLLYTSPSPRDTR